jgi:hypothetical protein
VVLAGLRSEVVAEILRFESLYLKAGPREGGPMQRRFTVGLAVAVILVAGACSKDSATTDPSPAAQESAAMPAGPVEYTAHDFGFDGPDTLPAGTSDITVKNIGANDHEMVIVRLDKHQDWTEQQIVDYIKNDPQAQPSWAVPVAGLLTESGPPVIKPGESAPVVFLDFSSGRQAPTVLKDGALEPGTYVFMCFLGSKQQPHAAMGMVKKVTVS